MNTCKKCANRIFDEKWGEYKCTVHKRRIRKLDEYLACNHFKNQQEEQNANTEQNNSG